MGENFVDLRRVQNGRGGVNGRRGLREGGCKAGMCVETSVHRCVNEMGTRSCVKVDDPGSRGTLWASGECCMEQTA